MSKDIRIRLKDTATGEYSIIVNPTTRMSLVEGLSDALNEKVDKVSGKGLSTEDYTTSEKNKLSGIEANANNYTHPASHPASMITESTGRRFVSDTEKSIWNGKQDESEKGQPDGYASLDSQGYVPASQINPNFKAIKVVEDIAERDALEQYEGLRVHVKDATADNTVEEGWAEYLSNGTVWEKTAEKESIDVILDWSNLEGRPTSSPASIDTAVIRSNHGNREVLDKITDSGNSASYDLASFLTSADIGDLGVGDMTKDVYDKNNDGKVDHADVADSVPWTGVTGVPSATTSTSGIVRLNNTTTSTSTTQAATANAVRLAFNEASSKVSIVLSPTQPTDADIWFEEIL